MSVSLLDAVRGLQQTHATQPSQPTQAVPSDSREFEAALDRLLRGEAANTPEVEAELDAGETGSTSSVTFSRHAQARLESRGIELSDEQLENLEEGIDALADRGANESLVLMDNTALIVGVPKRTVITAMSRSEAMGNIFTNIDSTLVID